MRDVSPRVAVPDENHVCTSFSFSFSFSSSSKIFETSKERETLIRDLSLKSRRVLLMIFLDLEERLFNRTLKKNDDCNLNGEENR